MRFKSYLLVAAALSAILPAAAAAQTQPQPQPPAGVDPSRVRVWRNPELDSRGPGWDFDFGVAITGNNQFGHIYVARLEPGNAAARAGLTVGDTILTIDGRDTRLPQPLFPVQERGTRYVMRVKRGDEEREIVYVHPGKPAPAAAAPTQRPGQAGAPRP